MSSFVWTTLSILLLDWSESHTPANSSKKQGYSSSLVSVMMPLESITSDYYVTTCSLLLWLTTSLQMPLVAPDASNATHLSSTSIWVSLVFAGTIASHLSILTTLEDNYRQRCWKPRRNPQPTAAAVSSSWFGYCTCCRSRAASHHLPSSIILSSSSSSIMNEMSYQDRSTPSNDVFDRRERSFRNYLRPDRLMLRLSLRYIAPSAWILLILTDLTNLPEHLSSSVIGCIFGLVWFTISSVSLVRETLRRSSESRYSAAEEEEENYLLTGNHSRNLSKSRLSSDESQWMEWSTIQLIEWVQSQYDAKMNTEKDMDEIGSIVNAFVSERIRGTQLPECHVGHPLLREILPRGTLHRLQLLIENRLLRPYPSNTTNENSSSQSTSVGWLQQHDEEYYNSIRRATIQQGGKSEKITGSMEKPDRILGNGLTLLQETIPCEFDKMTDAVGEMARSFPILTSVVDPHHKPASCVASCPTGEPDGSAASDSNFLPSHSGKNADQSLAFMNQRSGASNSIPSLPPEILEIVKGRPDLVQRAFELHRKRQEQRQRHVCPGFSVGYPSTASTRTDGSTASASVLLDNLSNNRETVTSTAVQWVDSNTAYDEEHEDRHYCSDNESTKLLRTCSPHSDPKSSRKAYESTR